MNHKSLKELQEKMKTIITNELKEPMSNYEQIRNLVFHE